MYICCLIFLSYLNSNQYAQVNIFDKLCEKSIHMQYKLKRSGKHILLCIKIKGIFKRNQCAKVSEKQVFSFRSQ